VIDLNFRVEYKASISHGYFIHSLFKKEPNEKDFKIAIVPGDMYWYEFDSAEIELAEQQAEAQAGGHSEKAVNKRVVGNLGEYTFEAFLEDFAHPDRWEYLNENARDYRQPEYEPFDFRVNKNQVDVKSTTNLLKMRPTAMVMANAEQNYHTLSEDDAAKIYVFILVDRGVWSIKDSNKGKPDREAALILGWATYEDLHREAFVDVGQLSRKKSGTYLPFNNIYDLLLKLGCTEPYPDL